VPSKAEEVNHNSASFTADKTLWALYLLMLGEAKSLHVIFTLVAFHQNFSANRAVSIHVALAEGFTTSIARRWAVGADHHVVGHVSSLEGICTHGALDGPPGAFFLVGLNTPLGDHC